MCVYAHMIYTSVEFWWARKGWRTRRGMYEQPVVGPGEGFKKCRFVLAAEKGGLCVCLVLVMVTVVVGGPLSVHCVFAGFCPVYTGAPYINKSFFSTIHWHSLIFGTNVRSGCPNVYEWWPAVLRTWRTYRVFSCRLCKAYPIPRSTAVFAFLKLLINIIIFHYIAVEKVMRIDVSILARAKSTHSSLQTTRLTITIV